MNQILKKKQKTNHKVKRDLFEKLQECDLNN